jgi:hypothetical protein
MCVGNYPIPASFQGAQEPAEPSFSTLLTPLIRKRGKLHASPVPNPATAWVSMAPADLSHAIGCASQS